MDDYQIIDSSAYCRYKLRIIKYAGKHDNLFVKILAAPGLWMQRLTTKEPDDSMIEVAIEAFKAALDENTTEDTAQENEA